MKKTNKKFSLSKYLKTLNEIDINVLISKIREINFEDIKKIDLKEAKNKILKSPYFNPTIGLIGASFVFTFILFPSINKLINNFSLANQYEMESNSLIQKELNLKILNKKLKKATLLMSELNQAIIQKEDLLFISKLINQTAIKSNVEINSFLPIDVARSAKLCNTTNRSIRKKNTKRTLKVAKSKGSFEDNFFEINLESNYLDMISFLNLIQNYNVIILPNCLKVSLEKDSQNLNDIDVYNQTNIIPLSESGIPLDTNNIHSKAIKSSPSKRVKSRLVLQIPSHSKI